MIMFLNMGDPANQLSRLDHLLLQAQSGDKEAKELLIADYIPFILKTTAKSCGRFVRIGQDDEVSISLIAFNEAIDKYRLGATNSFLSFAETVIKRRLIDYYRRESRKRELVFSNFSEQNPEEEGKDEVYWLERSKAQEIYDDQQLAWERRQEILKLNEVLGQYKLNFSELVRCCPKHEDARRRALLVATTIALNENYRNYLLSRKNLPVKQLAQEVNLSRKTIERQRKYIIALTIVVMGDFPFLQDYLFR